MNLYVYSLAPSLERKFYAVISVFILCIFLTSCDNQTEPETQVKVMQELSSFPKKQKTEVLLNEGESVYKTYCAACHDGGDPGARKLDVVKMMSPDAIQTALMTGKMKQQASALNDKQRNELIAWLTAGQIDVSDWESQLSCTANTVALDQLVPWVSSWGFNDWNHRVQSRSKLSSDNVNDLDELWVIAFPGASTMRSQPVVLGNTLFLAVNELQKVYALDRNVGCIKWIHASDSAPRTALTLTKLKDKYVLLFGDTSAHVNVLNTSNGEIVWRKKLGVSPKTTFTGPIVVRGDTFYLPHSSTETIASVDPNYECCQLPGALSKHKLADGEQLWLYRTVRKAEPREISSAGTQLWGPSGASVWAAPVVDHKKNTIFIGTGPISAPPDEGTGDAVIALNTETGNPRWTYQATKNDLWNGSCRAPHPDGIHPNCPSADGVDLDFGAGLMRVNTPTGNELLIAGQKSGVVHALNADTGTIVWQQTLGSGGLLGGIHWGMAYDDGALYVPVNDPNFSKHPLLSENYKKRLGEYQPRTGLYRLDINTGELDWIWTPKLTCEAKFVKQTWPECPPQYGLSAAIQVVNDLVIAGSMDGKWRAINKTTGKQIAEFNTYKEFTNTLNGVKGHGGSIDNASLTVADNMVYVQSGYAYFGGTPGNVLVAYRINQEKIK